MSTGQPMRVKWTPPRRLLESCLEDGEWHDFDQIFPYVALLVDPRFAARIWRREHDGTRRSNGLPSCEGNCPHYDAEHAVARGRWGWFIHCLRYGRARGRYEVEHWSPHQGRVRLKTEVDA